MENSKLPKLFLEHDIQKNYLIVEGNETCNYMVKMLTDTKVQGLLELEVRKFDNQYRYYYDITGKESVAQRSKKEKWKRDALENLFAQILQCLSHAKEYLLDANHFLLDPQYIFVDGEETGVHICYTWEYEKDINLQCMELFSYFMNEVDYDDKEAVEMVYKLYHASRDEQCTLQSLWAALSTRVEMSAEEKIENDIVEKKTGLELAGQFLKGTSGSREKKKIVEPNLKNEGRNDRKSLLPTLKFEGEQEKKIVLPSLKLNRNKDRKAAESRLTLENKTGRKATEPRLISENKTGEKTTGLEMAQEGKLCRKPVEIIWKAERKNGGKAVKADLYLEENDNKKIKRKSSYKEQNEEDIKIPYFMILLLQVALFIMIYACHRLGLFMVYEEVSYMRLGGAILVGAVLDGFMLTKLFEYVEQKQEKTSFVRPVEKNVMESPVQWNTQVEPAEDYGHVQKDNTEYLMTGEPRPFVYQPPEAIPESREDNKQCLFPIEEKAGAYRGDPSVTGENPLEYKAAQLVAEKNPLEYKAAQLVAEKNPLEYEIHKAVAKEHIDTSINYIPDIEGNTADIRQNMFVMEKEEEKTIASVEIAPLEKNTPSFWNKIAGEQMEDEEKMLEEIKKYGEATVCIDWDQTVVQVPKSMHPVCYLIPIQEEEQEKEKPITICNYPFFIGRFQKNTNQLKEKVNISRMHCKIEEQNGKFFVTDLNSTNGTFVNKKKIEKKGKQQVQEGDEIAIADVVYQFALTM